MRKLRDAARFALAKPEIRDQIVRLGMIPDAGPTPEKLAAYIDAEMARWARWSSRPVWPARSGAVSPAGDR